MGRLTVKPFSIKEFVDRLKAERGFSFARYGDGTFMSMMGREGTNCDGAEVSIRQAQELRASLLDAAIAHGIGDKAVEMGAGAWLEKEGIEIEWYDCNVLHTASLRGKLFPFVSWLRRRKVVMIGPSHLRRFKAFPVHAFVEAHPTGAFDQIEDLSITAAYAVTREQAEAVLISAGPAAPPLVSKLHQQLPWVNVLDVGSLWDAYVGVLSRKVFRISTRQHIRDLGWQNFKQETGDWWKT